MYVFVYLTSCGNKLRSKTAVFLVYHQRLIRHSEIGGRLQEEKLKADGLKK